MNIWYVNHYAGGPGIGPAYRPYELAAAWKKQGHTVTVFVASFHHLQSCDGLKPGVFEAGGVRYVAIAARRYDGNSLSRLLNMADFARGLKSAAAHVPAERAKPDVIIASSPHPFAIYQARSLAKRFGAKLVFEIRDIWPLSITEITGTSRFHPFVQACAHAERFAYLKADLISSVLPRADRYLAEKGWGAKPFIWVPNGAGASVQTEITSATGRHAIDQMKHWRQQGKTVLVHAGSMGPPNGLLQLIEAVCAPEAAPLAEKLALLLVGSGPLEDEIKRRAQTALCEVSVFDRVPKEDVRAIVQEASFGYAGVNNFPKLYKFGVSLNKVADYLAAGTPVFLPTAACGEPVSEAKAGLAKEVTSVGDMCAALHELVSIPEDERLAMGARGRHYMQDDYNFDAIAARYAAAIVACGKAG